MTPNAFSNPSSPGAPGEAKDEFARIETRGIDFIPKTERHGRARELFTVWMSSNVAYFYIVLGGIMILLGLDAVQAIAVTLAGNCFWILVGLLSASGPSAGTPSNIVTRAMYGVRGNRLNAALSGWIIAVAYEAINLTVGALAGFALVQHLGIDASFGLKVAIVLVIAAVTLTISVYGHATIVKLSGPFTLILLAGLALLIFYVLPKANLSFVPTGAPHGAALWGAIFAGFTIIASGPLSWWTAADYSRYLPPSTSWKSVVWWTSIGGFIPSALLTIVGILAGTVIDMTNPQESFSKILPGWFYLLFLIVIIVGSITNNVLTAYSSGLALQALGVKARRSITVLFDGFVGCGVALYALFISNFVNTLENILSLSVALLGPCMGIYAIDIIMRRNRYDGKALNIDGPDGPFWFSGGYNVSGLAALIAGTFAALMCVNTPVYVSPISNLLDGADISSIVGPIVGAVLYWALMYRQISSLQNHTLTAAKTHDQMQQRIS